MGGENRNIHEFTRNMTGKHRMLHPIKTDSTTIQYFKLSFGCCYCFAGAEDHQYYQWYFWVWGWSDIKRTSACYMWPVHDISMSLAYIGKSGGEVAMLVPLFSIHMSKLYKWTKLLVWLKGGPCGGQIFASRRSESERDSLQVSVC
jgi:hypothetical protein